MLGCPLCGSWDVFFGTLEFARLYRRVLIGLLYRICIYLFMYCLYIVYVLYVPIFSRLEKKWQVEG